MKDSNQEAETGKVSSSRRDSLKKIAGSTSVALAAMVTHRPVMAASSCTASGFVSAVVGANESAVARYSDDSCGFYSPGGWKNPYIGTNNSINPDGSVNGTLPSNDGGIADWISLPTFGGVKIAPNEPVPGGGVPSGAPSHYWGNFPFGATPFATLFASTTFSGTIEDALHEDGTYRLEKFAANALLGALYNLGTPNIITPTEVVNVYNGFMDMTDTRFPDASTLADFFEGLLH